MKLVVSLALVTSMIAIAGFWGSFTVHFAMEMARFGWELVDLIFKGE